MNGLRETVLEAESRRCAAMLAGDAMALERLLDPRLHFSHATGVVDDKEGYLAKIAAGRIEYLAIKWSEQKIIVFGETVLLAGRMSTDVRVDGVEKRLENRVLSVWAQEGDWRLVAFQSTPLAK
jgi:ketosteroid isomerase-like protein